MILRACGEGRSSPSTASCCVAESRLYVATPALLRYIGIDPAAVDPSTDFLVDRAVRTDELVMPVEKPAQHSRR